MKSKKPLTLLVLLASGLSACLPASVTIPTSLPVDSVASVAALTFEALQTQSAATISGLLQTPEVPTQTPLLLTQQGAATETPMPVSTTGTPLPTNTSVPVQASFTPVPGSVTVSVSVSTNCRTGPAKEYDYVGALLVGESTEVIGRDANGYYWYVRNPDEESGFCWLWDYYATVTGNTSALPVYTPMPFPTNSPVPTGTGTVPGATRIIFEKNSIGVTLQGSLPDNGIHTYVLRALEGQNMTVDVTSTSNMLLSIWGNDGTVLKSSGAGTSNWTGPLPTTQDYYLAIHAADGKAADYTLQVIIPPK